MASVNVQATFCKSNTGAHAAVTFKVNTVTQGVYPMDFTELQNAITDEEKQVFVRLFLRLHLLGKTAAQLRSDMLAGMTVTI